MGHSPHPAAPRLLRAAVLVAIAAATLTVACNHHKPTAPGLAGTAIADSLVFTRPDLSVVEMGTTPLVCCGLFDPSFVNERAMRIVFYDPSPTNPKPGWQIIVLIDHAQAGVTIHLPTVVVPPSRVPAVEMFVADLGNELSTSSGASSGTLTVHSFHCDASSIQIYFTVNAALGSELAGGPFMSVHGSFRATFPAAACP
jgi:hypothetical protein